MDLYQYGLFGGTVMYRMRPLWCVLLGTLAVGQAQWGEINWHNSDLQKILLVSGLTLMAAGVVILMMRLQNRQPAKYRAVTNFDQRSTRILGAQVSKLKYVSLPTHGRVSSKVVQSKLEIRQAQFEKGFNARS